MDITDYENLDDDDRILVGKLHESRSDHRIC